MSASIFLVCNDSRRHFFRTNSHTIHVIMVYLPTLIQCRPMDAMGFQGLVYDVIL